MEPQKETETVPIGEYEVFSNFRPSDTRYYKGDEELRKGEGIWHNVVKTIYPSQISIPVFSLFYAQSKYCLKELVEITGYRKRDKGHLILPFFYPGDITGPAFDEEAALGAHVSGPAWLDLINNNYALEIDELVGTDDQVERVVDWLNLGSQGVDVVGLHDIGAVGNTAIATAVYNKISSSFNCYNFVENIREAQQEKDGGLVVRREIVRRENIEQPWMRSRIWPGKETIELLNKCKNQVKGIRVNSGSDDVPELDSACYTELSELRYFDAGETRLNGDFNNLPPPNLKWMQLQNHIRSSGYSMPNFNMKKVIMFDVNAEGLGDDCIQTKEAEKLQVLHLPNCRNMSKLSEFPRSGNSDMLRIDHFKNRGADIDFEELRNLKELKLVSCELGKFKAGTIGTMKELRELNLHNSNCNFDSFRGAIADIGELSSLEILNVKSHYLADVLEGVKLPKSLKYMITQSGFANIEELMELEECIIIGSSMKTTELVIPPAFDDSADESSVIPWINSSKLKVMKLHSVKKIVMVDSKRTMLPSFLATLHIHKLYSEQLPNLKNLVNLTELEIKDCPNIEEVHGLGGMKSLQILRIYNAGKLTWIHGLGNLMSSSSCRLTNLEIHKCPLLRAVLTFEQQRDYNGGAGRDTDLVRIESLLNLEISGCQSLDGRSIPRLSKCPKIKVLRIEEIQWNINSKTAIQQYQLLEGLENLEELVSLTVHHLPKVQRLPSLSKLIKLSYLSLQDLPSLLEIAGLGELKMLRQLKVSRCLLLERLSVADLPLLTMYRIELDLRECTNLVDVNSDLSPLTDTTRGGDLGKLKVIIRWPHEHEEVIEKNLLFCPQRFLWSH